MTGKPGPDFSSRVKQDSFFEPGDGGTYPRIVGRLVTLKGGLLLFRKNFSRSGTISPPITLLAIQIAQGLEDGFEFPAESAVTGRHPELPFHVLRV